MPFLTPFLVGRVPNPTKIDVQKRVGTLIPAFLLEDLAFGSFSCRKWSAVSCRVSCRLVDSRLVSSICSRICFISPVEFKRNLSLLDFLLQGAEENGGGFWLFWFNP